MNGVGNNVSYFQSAASKQHDCNRVHKPLWLGCRDRALGKAKLFPAFVEDSDPTQVPHSNQPSLGTPHCLHRCDELILRMPLILIVALQTMRRLLYRCLAVFSVEFDHEDWTRKSGGSSNITKKGCEAMARPYFV